MSNNKLASIKSESDTSLTEEDTQCEQCGNIPDNYVKLDCDHRFCLVCLAYDYIQVKQSSTNQIKQQDEHHQSIDCSRCHYKTPLDPETVQALQDVIEQVLLPMSQQQHEIYDEPERDYVPTKLPQKQLQQSQPSKLTTSSSTYIKDQSLQNLIIKERALPYLDKLNECFQLKIINLQSLGSNKGEYSERCGSIKEQINKDFHQIIYQIEQQRNQLLNEINNMELKYMLQIQKEEAEQETDAQNLQALIEQLDQLIKSSNRYMNSHLQEVLLQIEQALDEIQEPDLSMHQSHMVQLNKFKLQSEIFIQQLKPLREKQSSFLSQGSSQSPKYNEANNTESQLKQIMSSWSGKSAQQGSKYLKTNDRPQSQQQNSPQRTLHFDKTDRGSSQKKLPKSNWKDQILDIFDQKAPKLEPKRSVNNVNFNIHQALSMQQQHYILQKESIYRK